MQPIASAMMTFASDAPPTKRQSLRVSQLPHAASALEMQETTTRGADTLRLLRRTSRSSATTHRRLFLTPSPPFFSANTTQTRMPQPVCIPSLTEHVRRDHLECPSNLSQSSLSRTPPLRSFDQWQNVAILLSTFSDLGCQCCRLRR